ncbi:MAG: YdcF family protein [Phycisphaerae bacterium]|nr:YdcF family protein [Phycisphaerae bacterium]
MSSSENRTASDGSGVESIATAGSLTEAMLDRDRPRTGPLRRIVRWIERGSAIVLLACAVFILSPISDAVYRSMDCADELRPAKFIICLGGNGNRIIESVRLLKEGWAETLVVTNVGRYAEEMRQVAVDWGADPSRVVVDRESPTTRHHPEGSRKAAHIDIANDVCIIVTSYTHLKRSRACFERAGYRHLIMREPRWERGSRDPEATSWKGRFLIFPQMVYEGAAWIEYRIREAI